MDDKKQPIIIKKVKKTSHGHHGGSWKVAFADFATAMMAFFMVMWLLQVATPETLGGISEYFKEVTMIKGKAVVPSPGMQGPGGASTSAIDLGGGLNALQEGEKEPDSIERFSEKTREKLVEVTREQAEQKKDKKRLDSLMTELQQALASSQALAPFKDQLLLDITPEGLRIQIVDKDNRPMFKSGSARLKYYTEIILLELAGFINTVPNLITISGHTDSIPLSGENGYSNWELSADRANAARRTLVEGGLAGTQLAKVIGLASSVPFDANNPHSAVNRRISILIMNRKAEQALKENSAQQQLNELPDTKVDTADDDSDGIEREINKPILTENPQPPLVTEQQASRDNDLNNQESEVETINPQEADKVPPAGKQPIRPNNNLRLPPVIDPALLPKNDVPEQ